MGGCANVSQAYVESVAFPTTPHNPSTFSLLFYPLCPSGQCFYFFIYIYFWCELEYLSIEVLKYWYFLTYVFLYISNKSDIKLIIIYLKNKIIYHVTTNKVIYMKDWLSKTGCMLVFMLQFPFNGFLSFQTWEKEIEELL